MILTWMMQLFSKNTCERVQFSNSKEIQRKDAFLEYMTGQSNTV